MSVTLSGPMFEPSQNGEFKSISGKNGAHYNIFSVEDGMAALKHIFPNGMANDLNFCLFSTSGIHGSYTSIEEIEASAPDEDGYKPTELTFLVVQPRLVCMRYGNCEPKTPDDFAFLKKLRETSWSAMANIGRHQK